MFDEEFFENEKKQFIMDSFKFQNGEVLNDVTVEYMTYGTPKYDENGLITNTILYCGGSLGSFAGISKILPLTFENCPFDAEKYFFVSLTALGSSGSCSPSLTGLKNKFPEYTMVDVVNFQKQFLDEKFGINHVLGLVGNSMGGFVGQNIKNCLSCRIQLRSFKGGNESQN